MDCTFEARRLELEAECVVDASDFEDSLERLNEFMLPFVGSFSRQDQRDYAERFVSGLCSDLERKNSESIAYHFQLERTSMQHFIGQSNWNDLPLRAELVRQVAGQLGEVDGIIILDPSSFVKSGKGSAGVARQWCGRLGKVESCQVGLYLAYASGKGQALVDTQLYLPQEWTSDKARMNRSGIPKNQQKYKTRHETYLKMLEQHRTVLPHQWITGDDELGRPVEFRRKIQEMGERYLFAVPSNTNIRIVETVPYEATQTEASISGTNIQIAKWAATQPAAQWSKIEVRDTEKGPLIIELTMSPVETGHKHRLGVTREMAIAIRYVDRDRKLVKQDFYLSNAAPTTPATEFARVAKAEHRIEECFKQGKGQAGMGDYEVRNWSGWHHHQTMTLLASWFLNVETRRAEKKITGNYAQPSASGDRFDYPKNLRMRFAPRRLSANNQAIDQKSASSALSLA